MQRTKSKETPSQNLENNIDANDEKCHKMSQLMLEDTKHGQEISELISALRKIGYFGSFRVKDNEQLSGEKPVNTQKRRLKKRKKAAYRRIKKYYKSVKQYQKERLRRKLCWLLSGKYKESEIAEMLGISRRTVIRDMNKIKPYYFRLSRNYLSQLEQERKKEFNSKLEGKTLHQQFKLLSEAIAEQRKRLQTREYKRHYQLIILDMTQLDAYGIPKLIFHPKGRQTLAYPYKIRVVIRGNFEGKEFTADIGGFNIVQKTKNWW